MRKIILYSAISLNNRIAGPDGNVDWLDSVPNPEKTDYGYAEFYKSVDTTIQGYNTYKQLVGWGIEFPYKGKNNYIITHRKNLNNTNDVEFISDNHIDFIRKLKKAEGGNIWLIGGGKVNTFLLNEGLVDEIRIFIMPVIIPGGIELFEFKPDEKQCKLTTAKSYSSGVVELKYLINEN